MSEACMFRKNEVSSCIKNSVEQQSKAKVSLLVKYKNRITEIG